MINFKITYKLIVFLLANIILFSGCKKTDEDEVDLIDVKKPLAFVFANTNSPLSGDFAQPILKRTTGSRVPGISGSEMIFISLYPEDTDPLYSRIAEGLKNQYDDSGLSYPAFVADGFNYGVDTNKFYNRLRLGINQKADISLGQRLSLEDSNLQINIKMKYLKDVTYQHSFAVYVVFRSFSEAQRSSTGTNNFYAHGNVVRTSLTDVLGVPLSASDQDQEKDFDFSYDIEDFSVDNIMIAVVIYKT